MRPAYAEVLADEVEVPHRLDGGAGASWASVARGAAIGAQPGSCKSGAFVPYVSLSGALARMPSGRRRSLIDPGGLGRQRRGGMAGCDWTTTSQR